MRGQRGTGVLTSIINSQLNAKEFSPRFLKRNILCIVGFGVISSHPSISLKRFHMLGILEVQDCNQGGNVGSGIEA